MTPGTLPTQMPGPQISSLSQSIGSEDTGAAGQPNGLQPPDSDAGNSSSGGQTVSNDTPGVIHFLQPGQNETAVDVLDGQVVGLAFGPDDALLK
jgi:hypothetical protein